MVSLPENLEEKLKILDSSFHNLTEKIFLKRTNLKRLAYGVYTDKTLVYKFSPAEKSEPSALKRAKGIEGVQKFVNYKYDILVSEYIDAKPFKVGTELSKERLEKLMDSLISLRERDISFRDCTSRNLLYSKKEGFTLIDFCDEENNPSEPYLPIHDLAFFMTQKEEDKKYLEIYIALFHILQDKNEDAARKTLVKLVNRDDIECLYPFKTLNSKYKNFSALKKIFERYGFPAKKIRYNRYAGLFEVSGEK